MYLWTAIRYTNRNTSSPPLFRIFQKCTLFSISVPSSSYYKWIAILTTPCRNKHIYVYHIKVLWKTYLSHMGWKINYQLKWWFYIYLQIVSWNEPYMHVLRQIHSCIMFTKIWTSWVYHELHVKSFEKKTYNFTILSDSLHRRELQYNIDRGDCAVG